MEGRVEIPPAIYAVLAAKIWVEATPTYLDVRHRSWRVIERLRHGVRFCYLSWPSRQASMWIIAQYARTCSGAVLRRVYARQKSTGSA
jgi:hypothetical protein